MFKSTRGKESINASLAILKGIASDGGLFIKDIPNFDYKQILGLSYKEMAKKIFGFLLTDFTTSEIDEIVEKAYTDTFSTPDLVEIKSFQNKHFLEIFHGPTLAFKDIALTILPYFMIEAKKKNHHEEETVILTATSGDTGAAALNGFKDRENISIIVFYPYNGVSEVQERQMLSFQGTNATIVALKGNFDDCQSFVKKIFVSKEIADKLKAKNKAFSSANSINIGRLIPQIVYYFYSYSKLYENKSIKLDEKINFSVPTGNFGNILAGHYAKKMGLPINKLICASNKNKVLTDFLSTGEYDINRPFFKTNSPSMDILISSNLERLLFELCENDPLKVSKLMQDLKENKKYDLSFKTDEFYANYATEEETLDAIKAMYEKTGYIMDTHTAIADKVYNDYLNETNDELNTVIISTASPFKFPFSVAKALKLEQKKSEFEQIEEISEKGNRPVPEQIKKLEKLEKKQIVWSLDEAYDKLLELLGVNND